MCEVKFIDNDPYYACVPHSFKEAVFEDFFIDEFIIIGLPYLIHSEINPNYFWAKRTKPDFMNHNDFYLFLDKKRIYVLR